MQLSHASIGFYSGCVSRFIPGNTFMVHGSCLPLYAAGLFVFFWINGGPVGLFSISGSTSVRGKSYLPRNEVVCWNIHKRGIKIVGAVVELYGLCSAQFYCYDERFPEFKQGDRYLVGQVLMTASLIFIGLAYALKRQRYRIDANYKNTFEDFWSFN